MKKEEVKEQLIKAAMELLREAEKPERVTTRQITQRAGTNPAMVNYCFGSKDELLNEAVGRIVADSADFYKTAQNDTLTPRQKLLEMLAGLSNLVVRYYRYTKLYVPYILLRDDIIAPLYILPILREYFGTSRTELEMKVIAYQMLSFLQLVFYRADTFFKYSGADILNEKVRTELIKSQVELFLGKEDGNEPDGIYDRNH